MVVIGVPILINCLFKLSAPVDLLVAEWTADSALGYYGTVLTFLSTTALSALALWQNHIIKEENDKHTALLERMEREKNAPYLFIEDVVGHGNASDLTFSLKNISENIAKDITIFQFHIIDKNNNVRWSSKKEYHIPYLNHTHSEKIRLFNEGVVDEEERVCFCITYHDKFDNIYNCEVVGQFTNGVTIPHFVIEEKFN